MQITVHVNGYYDWEPVPKDAEVSQKDIDARSVKPDGLGGYLMKVNKEGDTTTTVGLPESQIIAAIIDEMTRGDHQHLTRKQAVARYLSRHVMPHHAHKKWMKEIEVDDAGPDEAAFRDALKKHVEAGNIDSSDVEPMVKEYMSEAAADDHVDHLHGHFGIKGHEEHKAARLAKKDEEAPPTDPGAAQTKEVKK